MSGSSRDTKTNEEQTQLQQTAAQITGVFKAVEAGEPMIACARAWAEQERGLVGDRYHAGIGTFSQRFEIVPGARALSLIDTFAIVRCEQRLGQRIKPGELRRNLIIDGLDLMSLRGARLRIGNAEIELVGACPPCGYLSRLLDFDFTMAFPAAGRSVGPTGVRT